MDYDFSEYLPLMEDEIIGLESNTLPNVEEPDNSDATKSSKLLACARCHLQKLRCPRDTADPCSRCIQAGAECVNRSPKRMGRPKGVTTGDSATQSKQRSEEASGSTSDGGTSTNRRKQPFERSSIRNPRRKRPASRCQSELSNARRLQRLRDLLLKELDYDVAAEDVDNPLPVANQTDYFSADQANQEPLDKESNEIYPSLMASEPQELPIAASPGSWTGATIHATEPALETLRNQNEPASKQFDLPIGSSTHFIHPRIFKRQRQDSLIPMKYLPTPPSPAQFDESPQFLSHVPGTPLVDHQTSSDVDSSLLIPHFSTTSAQLWEDAGALEASMVQVPGLTTLTTDSIISSGQASLDVASRSVYELNDLCDHASQDSKIEVFLRSCDAFIRFLKERLHDAESQRSTCRIVSEISDSCYSASFSPFSLASAVQEPFTAGETTPVFSKFGDSSLLLPLTYYLRILDMCRTIIHEFFRVSLCNATTDEVNQPFISIQIGSLSPSLSAGLQRRLITQVILHTVNSIDGLVQQLVVFDRNCDTPSTARGVIDYLLKDVKLRKDDVEKALNEVGSSGG